MGEAGGGDQGEESAVAIEGGQHEQGDDGGDGHVAAHENGAEVEEPGGQADPDAGLVLAGLMEENGQAGEKEGDSPGVLPEGEGVEEQGSGEYRGQKQGATMAKIGRAH